MVDETLIEAALQVRQRAHAPYSGFAVGAAIRSADGRVFSGCNVENAAFPEGMCAEAGALSAMVAGGGLAISEVAIVAAGRSPVPPCGGCRQKLAEFAGPEVPVTMAVPDGPRLTMSMAELLPGAFGPAHMARS